MLGCCGATRRRLANVGKSPICFKHSRGGPIAAQTTGDRKEKSDDHKEDLRQKPHDRRRQSTYLHAVPERRCPSMAGSWCCDREKFRNGLKEVNGVWTGARMAAGGSTEHACSCKNEWSASRCCQPVPILLPACPSTWTSFNIQVSEGASVSSQSHTLLCKTPPIVFLAPRHPPCVVGEELLQCKIQRELLQYAKKYNNNTRARTHSLCTSAGLRL